MYLRDRVIFNGICPIAVSIHIFSSQLLCRFLFFFTTRPVTNDPGFRFSTKAVVVVSVLEEILHFSHNSPPTALKYDNIKNGVLRMIIFLRATALPPYRPSHCVCDTLVLLIIVKTIEPCMKIVAILNTVPERERETKPASSFFSSSRF